MPLLIGTDPQVAYAENVRAAMVRRLNAVLSPDAFRAMRGIEDATWWISNKDREADAIRWPSGWFEAQQTSGGMA